MTKKIIKKVRKQTTVKDWEQICENLNMALNSMMNDEAKLQNKIEKLEEQLTMSVGVIKYLEMKLERPNPV
jgi:hypothetical protein